MGSSWVVPLATAISILATFGSGAQVAGSTPQLGCYERSYDAKHLRSHPGQIVRRIVLDIEPLRPAQLASGHGDVVGNADLRIWVKGQKRAFASYGACKEKDGGYDCLGHDLANEHRNCKTSNPGVHNCRSPEKIDRFRLESRPDRVQITIPESLQLSASETGPYLNLMASDRENSRFVLSIATPLTSCPALPR